MEHDIPQYLLDLMLDVILDVLKGKSGSIMLTDGTSSNLTIQSARGLKKEIIRTARTRLGSGISGKVAETDIPLFIKGVNADRREQISPSDLRRPDLDNALILPLKLRNGTVGTLNINSIALDSAELEEKHRTATEIVSRFFKYLVETPPPAAHHEPPSRLYMLNLFREYNVLRELRVVFDYIFQVITDISGLQKKGVFFLKDRDGTFFDLVLGYGFEAAGYRTIYEELLPSLQKRMPQVPQFMEVFNRSELLTNPSHLFEEPYLILFPMTSEKKGEPTHGQLVLFSAKKPRIPSHSHQMLKILCRRGGKAIKNALSNQDFQDFTRTDNLTGTYNYGLWWKRLDEEFSRTRREGQGTITLLVLDIDRFDRINHTHGFYVGDQVLRLIADKICACVRSNDIVGRIGGEEFGVILLQADRSSARMIGQRILNAIADIPLEMRLDLGHPLSMSGGIAAHPDDAVVPGELVEKARTALVSAKIMGGGTLKLFDHLEE